MRVRLKPAAEAEVRGGHPWVFNESVREQNREGRTGELAVIFDRKDQFLAIGFYDATSPIRIRVVHRGKPATIDGEWWRRKLLDAISLRTGVFDAETDGGRWVNGESDGFPALVLDRYAETLVLKLYSAVWIERLEEIVRIVNEELRPERLILRLSRNIAEESRLRSLSDGHALIGDAPVDAVVFQETGIRFEADVLRGQKTGFFLDQRENRRLVGEYAAGRQVLNAFSFSGGFSLYAAQGGATSVTDVDISAHALESARRNFALNAVQSEHELVQANVFDWLKEQRTRRWDLVVLDPPSLAKRQQDRPAALKAYAGLAESGFRVTNARGVTVCCSCSAHVRAPEFFQTVVDVAERSGRKFRILQQTREPIDHHAEFTEAEYLKAIYVQF